MTLAPLTKTVLKIANNRITYSEISYPKTWKVIAGQRFGISLEALAELTTSKIATIVEPATRTAIMVKGGATVEFSLPADAKATVIAQLSFYSWALQAIGLALTVGTKIAKLAGIVLKDNGFDRLLKVLTNPLNLDEWGKAAQSCLKSYTKQFTNDLTKPVELGDTATKIFKFAGTCTIAMGKVSAEESGPLIYVTSKLLDAVLTLASAVVSAAELLVSIRREIWDSITSFGGGNNPIYILRLTPKEAATTIVNLNPLDASGRPKPGYSVVAESHPLECSPFGDSYPSPSAVSSNIYACDSVATNADVCWVDPGADHAYCQVSPWFKTLRRFQLGQWPVSKVAPMHDPLPWGLELATGTQCLRRIGGSWSGRPDGWVGAYSCEGVEFVVLADSNNNYADIDKSRPTWVVRVGVLSDTATSLPAPKPVAVRTAYFASRG